MPKFLVSIDLFQVLYVTADAFSFKVKGSFSGIECILFECKQMMYSIPFEGGKALTVNRQNQ